MSKRAESVLSIVVAVVGIAGATVMERRWPQAFAPVLGAVVAVMVLLTAIVLIRKRQKKHTG